MYAIRSYYAHQLKLVEDERLEQFQRHELGQTALVQLELRAHHDHGTTGVVHALAQQVLTEAAALTLDHVGQRLERTLVGAGHGLAATRITSYNVCYTKLLRQALLALGFLAEGHGAGVLGEHAGILRRTGFVQLGHARQTPGNIAGLSRFLGDAGKNLTSYNFV